MSEASIQLLVGLGNPGSGYARTRHNAGFWFIERLLGEQFRAFKSSASFQGITGSAEIEGYRFRVLLPSTYMNHSGQAVSALARYYEISAGAIIVAHDELDLPAGVVRLKFGGGTAGHKGIESISNHLKTRDFHRLRIGIARPTGAEPVVSYVLHAPSEEERIGIDGAMDRAVRAFPLMLRGKPEEAKTILGSATCGDH